MINAVTESTRLSRFSRAGRANGGWQLSLLDSCPEETEGVPQCQTARLPGFGTGVRQSVCPTEATRSLRQRKITTVEVTLRFQAGPFLPPEIWASVLQCCYSRVAISLKRCGTWGSVYFRVAYNLTSRHVCCLKRPHDYVIWHLQTTNPICKHFNVLFIVTCDFCRLQFTRRSSFYNQVYLGEKMY